MSLIRMLIVLLLAGSLSCAEAQVAAEKDDDAAPDEAKPVTLRLGNVLIDPKAKRVEIVGAICLEEGILDYLAVGIGGQEYESVLSLPVKGSDLHAGLLAIGAKPGPTKNVLERLKKDPPAGMELPKEPGTSLKIAAEWMADGKPVTVPAENLLLNRRFGKAQEKATWVFTGSYFARPPNEEREVYMADIDRTLIAVVYMGSAVINIEEDAGNPYADEDQGYEVNRNLRPPVGTAVKLTITLAEGKDEKKPE